MMVLSNARFRPATTRSQRFTSLLHASAPFSRAISCHKLPRPVATGCSCPGCQGFCLGEPISRKKPSRSVLEIRISVSAAYSRSAPPKSTNKDCSAAMLRYEKSSMSCAARERSAARDDKKRLRHDMANEKHDFFVSISIFGVGERVTL